MKRLKISITVVVAAIVTSGTIAAKAGAFNPNIAKADVAFDCYKKAQLNNPSATLPDEGSPYSTQTYLAANVSGGPSVDSSSECLDEPTNCCYRVELNPNQDPTNPNDDFLVTIFRGGMEL
jgi:hypothetical protein